jgi:hypothetical protein
VVSGCSLASADGAAALQKEQGDQEYVAHWYLSSHAGQRRYQQALCFSRRAIGVVPGAEAEIEAGTVHLVINDETIGLAVLRLLNRSDASGHVAASAGQSAIAQDVELAGNQLPTGADRAAVGSLLG